MIVVVDVADAGTSAAGGIEEGHAGSIIGCAIVFTTAVSGRECCQTEACK